MFGRNFKFSKWQEFWIYIRGTETLKEKTGHSQWTYDSTTETLKITSDRWTYDENTQTLKFR